MTTYERSVQIMADVLQQYQGEAPERLARRCLEAMRDKRIVPHTMRASASTCSECGRTHMLFEGFV